MPGISVVDLDVTLLKAGVATGDNKATATTWPTVAGTASYGGAADGWNASLTPADVNAVNFGVQLSASANGGATTANVDFIQITVTYLAGGVPGSMMMTGAGQ